MGFAVDGDGDSETSGSRSKRGDDPTDKYEAMQTRIATMKKERERKHVPTSKHATCSNKKKRVKHSTRAQGPVEANGPSWRAVSERATSEARA